MESTPSLTGAKADHRYALAPDMIERVALSLAAELGMEVRHDALPDDVRGWVAALARDLERVRGRSAVIAGECASPVVHALAHWINSALGNVAKAVEYSEPIEADPVVHADSIAALVSDMQRGLVSTLVIVGGNPAYDAPADLDFAGSMRKVEVVFRLGLYDDETSHHSHWHIPQAHWLESWSDARAFDGTATIQQPLIAPLYGGTSAHELIAAFMGEGEAGAYDLVRGYWQSRSAAGDFEELWQKSLHDGVVADTAAPARRTRLRWDLAARIENIRTLQAAVPDDGVEGEAVVVVFRPDPHVFDGRFANNPWLQELPKPHSKLVWDNAALVAPGLAERLGLRDGDVMEITAGGAYLKAPAWITPGQADGVVTLPLGYGRTHAGRIGDGRGFDAYPLRTTQSPWHRAGARVRNIRDHLELTSTQHHFNMEGRDLVRSSSLAEYLDTSQSAGHEGHEPASLYPEHEYDSYAWGMTIDLNTCIGCNACAIACQAENNIPVVGKDQVARGREMHWIRVDRYYEGDLDNPRMHHQPVPCMHCEKAPCEVVCPVNATVHSDEGLNDMVYNRCVGTRYCSNNCPYKVRRFNFFLYNDDDAEMPKLQRNPDVTVRTRGVMEKCTYCVQRISHARIEAKKEGRRIGDGDVVTACQQVCPVEAIVFGDINDPRARVTQLKGDRRNYALLAELGTEPRTTYLAAVRNPNPEIAMLEASGGVAAPEDAGKEG
jgi:molybdopterin-containing oxidoreductase family iron-sulfur binding subunit